jgi:iron complex outermembrane recepter protein
VGGVEGDRLPYIANWSWSLDADYTFAPMGDYTPFIGASWRFTGERDSGFDAAIGQTRLPSYHTFDLRAGVDRGAWSLQVFAKNVTDEEGVTVIGTTFADPPRQQPGGGSTAAIIRPRMIGVVLSGKI